jgi:hypothetical protein
MLGDMRKLLYVLAVTVVVIAGLKTGLYLKQRSSGGGTLSFDKINGIPFRPRFGATSLSFQKPLEVNQCVAIRKGANILVLKLLSVDSLVPDHASFQLSNADGSIENISRASDFVTFSGFRFRWSSRDKRSIWIYEDPDTLYKGNVGYAVMYPISSELAPEVFRNPSSFTWYRYVTNYEVDRE